MLAHDLPGRPRRRFVLVADDDRDTRELYRACFDTNGYRTAEAESGSHAIATALHLVPDVLLTDLVLPDVDGFTVAQRLRTDVRTAKMRVIVVTGSASPDLEARASAAGVDRVLLKPCPPQIVLREVMRSLGRLPPATHRTPTMAKTPERRGDDRQRSGIDRRDPVGRASALGRVRDEFAALPGLALTAEQARLVFELDRGAAERIMNGLAAEGFLLRTPHGAFRRPH